MNTTLKVAVLSLVGLIIAIGLYLYSSVQSGMYSSVQSGMLIQFYNQSTDISTSAPASNTDIIQALLFLLILLIISIVVGVTLLKELKKMGYESAGNLKFKGYGLDLEAGGVIAVIACLTFMPLILLTIFLKILPIFQTP
jgi:hypothetical protein